MWYMVAQKMWLSSAPFLISNNLSNVLPIKKILFLILNILQALIYSLVICLESLDYKWIKDLIIL